MRTDALPGLSAPVELAQIITAASFFVGAPILGWLVQRVVIRVLRKRRWFADWPGGAILDRAIHTAAIVWVSIAGAFAALSVLPVIPGLRHGLERLLFAILIAWTTVVAARVVADVVRLYSSRTERTMQSSSIFVNLSRIVVGTLGLLFLLQNLGISITPILTALGVGGLALALALQDTLSNFFAGLQIVATKKVKPGDFIKLDTSEEGYVVDIDWRHTSIRQLPNNMVLVPNAKLGNAVITNYHYPVSEMSLLLDVGVAYDSNLEHVERVTIDVARETLHEVQGGVPEFDPFIRFHTFNDFSIDYTVILRVREFTDQYKLRHEFVKRLHRRFGEEGIVIPFPIRTIDWPEARELAGSRERERLTAGAGDGGGF